VYPLDLAKTETLKRHAEEMKAIIEESRQQEVDFHTLSDAVGKRPCPLRYALQGTYLRIEISVGVRTAMEEALTAVQELLAGPPEKSTRVTTMVDAIADADADVVAVMSDGAGAMREAVCTMGVCMTRVCTTMRSEQKKTAGVLAAVRQSVVTSLLATSC
jgi:hypothetical protein